MVKTFKHAWAVKGKHVRQKNTKSNKKMRKWKKAYAITEIREITKEKKQPTEKTPQFLNFTGTLKSLNRVDSWVFHLTRDIFNHINFLAIMKMHSWYFPQGCGDIFGCLRLLVTGTEKEARAES